MGGCWEAGRAGGLENGWIGAVRADDYFFGININIVIVFIFIIFYFFLSSSSSSFSYCLGVD